MWYVVIYAFWRGWAPYFRSKRNKIEKVHAKVKAKQGREEYNAMYMRHEITQRVLVFECEDGLERDYEVHDDVFDLVEVGDDGILVYQGHLYVDFEARRPRIDLDKLYSKYTRT